MPITKLDDREPIENRHDSDDLLEVKIPIPKQKRRYAWIVLVLLLLLTSVMDKEMPQGERTSNLSGNQTQPRGIQNEFTGTVLCCR
jgi:hypothetical protein